MTRCCWVCEVYTESMHVTYSAERKARGWNYAGGTLLCLTGIEHRNVKLILIRCMW